MTFPRPVLCALLGTFLCAPATQGADAPAPAAKVPPEAPSKPGPPPYINQWLVSEAGPAATDRPAKPVRYFDDRLFSRNYDDYQDLRSYIGWIRKEKTEAIAVTASTGVWSPTACEAELRVGADQTCQAFVNDAPVGRSDKNMPLRDQAKWPIALRQGWNTLALRVASQNDGRLGFYARITAPGGAAIPGLVYAPAGDAGRLLVTTQPLDKGGDNPLPIGWREWPYVAMDPWGTAARKSFVPGAESRRAHSSPFLLSAGGGQPPYRWRITDGALPAGLALQDDGAVIGTVSADARIGRHPFTARVTDAAGATADKALWLEVRERPNKWLEEGRLVGLIHRPEHAPDNGQPGDREKQLDTFADLMRRQGYCAAIVIGWNNGDGAYRWPSRVGRASGRPLNPNGPEMGDLITPYKKAVTDHGMRFGFYMGQFRGQNDNYGGLDGMVRMFEEVGEEFHPDMVYLDWAFSFFQKRGGHNVSLDAAFSALRARNPDLIIQVNGSHTLPVNLNLGDWDSVSAEGWGAWGDKAWVNWPYALNWPKKQTMDSWRVVPDPKFYYTGGIEPDWKEVLGIQISLIAEGYTADIDHSTTLGRKPAVVADRLKDWTESAIYNTHVKMADWANPKDAAGKPLPPLHTAYTQCNPGPLAAAAWGYNTINLKRDTIYLHVLRNPRGKTGMPDGGKLTASPLPGKVASVTCMNTGKPVPFTQAGQELVVDAAQVAPDPVDTLFKVVLE